MSNDFIKMAPEEISRNVFELIGKDWMLVTAGTKEKFNMMTASWGGMGVLWNKNVVFCFIRPNRHTYQFMENNDFFTINIFQEEYRDELMFCGTTSGKDTDKLTKTGFTPDFTDNYSVYFKEASLVIECKKIYYQDINPEHFLSNDIANNYPQKDYHRLFIGEIVNCLIKE